MKYLLAIICSFCSFFVFSQEAQHDEKISYITVKTGLAWDNFASAGPGLYLEYMKRFKNKEKIYWGISLDNKWPGLSGIPSYKLGAGQEHPPELEAHQLSFNIHSLSRMGKSFLMFDFLSGVGAIYLFGEGKKAIQPTFSVGMTMNIRISKNTFIETTPLLIFPPSKISFSPTKLSTFLSSYTSALFVPIGLRVKL